MVGHTGNMDATITAVEAVDLALARLIKVVDKYNMTLLVTADRGNADEMYEKNKKGELQIRTAHSLNPGPFIIYEKQTNYEIRKGEFGIANVAPTIASVFKLDIPKCWEESMI
jgi:2,3-bisphosphoglycerate-independent phosphoglycerate mutase